MGRLEHERHRPERSRIAHLQLVTKFDLERALHRQTWGLMGVMFAQSAFIIAVLQLLG